MSFLLRPGMIFENFRTLSRSRENGGSIVKSYKYDAFGNIMQESGAPIYRGFTYTGRELHSRSGLYYYRFRFYDPSIGRFISQDPIGPVNGPNLYAYTGNNPVAFVDPLGLQCELWNKTRDVAVVARDLVVVPGLSAYGTYLLAEWNPYAVIIIPAIEGGAALYMFAVEQEYQASRSALMDTASRAQAGGVDPLLIGNTLNGVEQTSAAGWEAGKLGFSVGVSLAFTGAK